MKPTHIIIHHTAVSRELNGFQFAAIDRKHKEKGWGSIGYHYLIEINGLVKKGRGHDEEGAHCRELCMNYRSLGVCLTGNFELEVPINKQIWALRDLLRHLTTKYNIPAHHIYFHRNLKKATLCPGKNMDLDFIRSLIKKPSR